VGNYAKNLIDALARTEGDPLELFILAQDDDAEMDFGQYPNVNMLWVPARWFRILPLRFMLEQLGLPFLLLRHRINVLHSLHYAFPLVSFAAKRVVTFHDMTFFTMPEVHERIKVLYFRFFMRASAHLPDGVIFVSHSALADFTARLGIARGGTFVIPHGKSASFHPEISLGDLEDIRGRYGIRGRFILYVGTIEPRKNLPRLIKAFSSIAVTDPEIQLVLAGKIGWMADELTREIERLKLSSRVVFTGFIPEAVKPVLLAACTLFVYPSLYEGFGLPALEAIACGTPTVTSDLSALPEVVGDAALLVDPHRPEALAAAMQALLSSPSLREELKRRGPIQAAKFTWEHTAELTANAYRSVSVSLPKR
jgi:glycosyltransferase involved in cell wall biosynthesis